MREVVDISVVNIILFTLLMLIPITVLKLKRLAIWHDLVISIIRMVLQLLFVGFYLNSIFKIDSLWLNLAWLSVMVLIATHTVVKRSSLKVKSMFLPSLISIGLSSATIGILLLITVGATPIYTAPYLIPMVGMILGNSLQANIIATSSFYSDLRENFSQYEQALFNGATVKEALTPFVNRALSSAISPSIAGMATIGLVALPGMMTGQILGGTNPMEAIKYQIVIMVAIFLSLFFSVYLMLTISPKKTLNGYGILRDEISVSE